MQTVPALYYYISFFKSGFYIVNSTGMAPVWGCTIGAIATAIVTTALVPIPPQTITATFCAAVIIWEFLVCGSLFIAAVCLAIMSDYHGFVWSVIGSISTGCAGCFLLWLGLEVIKRRKVEKYENHLDNAPFRPPFMSSMSDNMSSDGRSSKSDVVIQIGERDRSSLDRSSLGTPERSERSRERSRERLSEPSDVPKHHIFRSSKLDSIPQPIGPSDDFFLDDIYSQDRKAVKTTTESEPNAVQRPSCLGVVKFCVIQILLWAILFVFSIIPAGFGIQQAIQLSELIKYGIPGTLYSIPSAQNSTISLNMHIYCLGPKTSRPTLLFEADKGTSGFSFFNMQSTLSPTWRVCTYDRGGYGWSALPPLGSSTPTAVAFRLHALLDSAGEGQSSSGIVLIGHGTGGELAQLYALTYPSQVSGLAILDGYPNIDRLMGLSTNSIYQSNLKKCSDLQISRALEPVALMRAVTDVFDVKTKNRGDQFVPQSQFNKYVSTQTNGKYWAAQYNDLCVNAGAVTAHTDLLNQAAERRVVSAYFTGNAVAWPSLPANRPVLVVSAGSSISGSDAQSMTYFRQAALYNMTLSSSQQSKWIVCASCDHSLAVDRDSTAVSGYIDQHFSNYF